MNELMERLKIFLPFYHTVDLYELYYSAENRNKILGVFMAYHTIRGKHDATDRAICDILWYMRYPPIWFEEISFRAFRAIRLFVDGCNKLYG